MINEQSDRIRSLLKEHNAVIVAHYYVDESIQAMAEATGGFVGDSLAMAKFGLSHPAQTLVVAGVRFMGESAKILSPAKRVLMPTLEATCSLDEGCKPEALQVLIDQHPDREVVVYANTSAAVKAMADWVVTSSNALDIVGYLRDEGKKILWAPDRYLGQYIQQETQADMVLYQGSCIVHEEFKATELKQMKKVYPDAAILVHPESPKEVCDLADVVGSTSVLLNAVAQREESTFIVATDKGIFYKMKQLAPGKHLIEAPTAGQGATCKSCAHCPWMAMNHLDGLEKALTTSQPEIQLPQFLVQQAAKSLQRMVDFKVHSLKKSSN